jgi:hypothetical protein
MEGLPVPQLALRPEHLTFRTASAGRVRRRGEHMLARFRRFDINQRRDPADCRLSHHDNRCVSYVPYRF